MNIFSGLMLVLCFAIVAGWVAQWLYNKQRRT